MATLCRYDEKTCDLETIEQIDDHPLDDSRQFWLDLDGEPTAATRAFLTKKLRLHPLAVEALFDENRQTRLMEFSDHLYLGSRPLELKHGPSLDDDPGSASNARSRRSLNRRRKSRRLLREPPPQTAARNRPDRACPAIAADIQPPTTGAEYRVENRPDRRSPADATETPTAFVLRRLGIVLSDRFLITAHRVPLAAVDRLQVRLETDAAGIRKEMPDSLLYHLLDAVVDDYYEAVDQMSERIDDFDTRDGISYDSRLQRDILDNKRHLLILHKAIMPLRDTLLNLRRLDNPLIQEKTQPYMRDLFEHVLQLLDSIDNYRDVLTNTVELAMAATNNRLSEVMTVLTVVSTFFIPLNFIVGYFGMNLKMPEMAHPITYPIVIVVLIATVTFMYFWMRRRKFF